MRRFEDVDKSPFLLIGLSLANFVIHLLTNGQYGFFRDELYILDCAKHLDLGYADMPPLTPLFAKIVIFFLGETLQGLWFFPAFLSSMMVLMTGLMTREMGGKLYAQLLASIAFMIAPIFLVAGTQFQTIVIDQFFWVLTCYLLIKFINSGNQKLWLLIGVSLGLGLLTKYSAVFLGFAIFFGLIISHHRKILNQHWIWFGVSIALLLFLPNLVWQIQNGLPVVDHMEALGRDETTPSLQFLIEQIIILHPLNLPIWITGIIFLTTSEAGKKYLLLVWIYFIPLLVFLSSSTYLVGQLKFRPPRCK
jgi:4-amino-4-deoxy-L-arabinose transferase-like glycosyltransferase